MARLFTPGAKSAGRKPNTDKTSGDRQHLWTPVAVVRFLRDALVMEQDDQLHLARGIERTWLESGQEVGIEDAPTHFGTLTYRFSLDPARTKLAGVIDFPASKVPYNATLHCRLPEGLRVVSVDKASRSDGHRRWRGARMEPSSWRRCILKRRLGPRNEMCT